MGWVRIDPDGTRTPVQGDPFASRSDVGSASPRDLERAPPGQPAEAGGASPLLDMILSAGTGLRRGAEGMVAAGGEANKGLDWLGSKVGLPEGSLDIRALANPAFAAMPGGSPLPEAPDTQAVKSVTDLIVGEERTPQTTAGEYARTVGEFVPGALAVGGSAGPGLSGLGRMLLGSAAVPGLASEAAGQATEGTDLEPYARAAGGLAGGVAGHAAFAPRQALTRGQVRREDLQRTARRMNMELPEFMMPDAPGQSVAARRIADLPFLGGPVRRASERVAEDMGERVRTAAGGIGNPDMPTVSGQTRNTLEDFVRSAAPAAQREAFDEVDNLIVYPNLRTPLTNTRQLMDEFRADMMADTTATSRPVLRQLAEATRRPGLTYAALKRLRTSIGEQMDDNQMPAASRRPLRAAYRSLTQDLEHAIRNAGGTPAHEAWQRANQVTRVSKNVSEEVQRFIGKGGDVPADQVLKRFRGALQGQDDSQRNQLYVLRAAMDEADIRGGRSANMSSSWEDLAAATLADMGTDPRNPGVFSPRHYLTNYSRMSETGRRLLFEDPLHRRTVDDLAELARNFRDVRTPSAYGMGMTAATGGALGVGAVASWPTVLGGIVAGRTISQLLASPAASQKLLSWARASQGAGRATPGTLQTSARVLANELAEREDRDPQELYRKLVGSAGGRDGRRR